VENAKQWFAPDVCLYWASLTTQQGTPIFMARSVVAGRHLLPSTCIPCGGRLHGYLRNLPRLSDDALLAYKTHLLDRLQSFPQPTADQDGVALVIPSSVDVSVDGLRRLPWTHELWHDAESVFWLLVWWAIHLRTPRDKTNSNDPSKIDQGIFGDLVRVDLAMGVDRRKNFMATLADGEHWLDPAYRELEPLFLQMVTRLDGDLYWAKYGGCKYMEDPEFLHEALRRIIFNFLMEHREAKFMQSEKYSLHRGIEPQHHQHAEAPSSNSSGKRTHSTMSGEPEHEVSRVSHLSSPGAHETTYSCRRRSAQGSFLRHIGGLRSLEQDES